MKAKKTDTPEVAHQKKMMKMTLGKYRERPNEVFARLVEQYSAYKLGEASEMAKTFEDYTTSK